MHYFRLLRLARRLQVLTSELELVLRQHRLTEAKRLLLQQLGLFTDNLQLLILFQVNWIGQERFEFAHRLLINLSDLGLKRLRLLGVVRNGLLRLLQFRIRLIIRWLIEKVLLLLCLLLLHFFSDRLLGWRSRQSRQSVW